MKSMEYPYPDVITRPHRRDEVAWRHWCPASETYAPVEVLLQYLRQGWEADTSVTVETFFLGTRHSFIYRFTMRYNGSFLEIPVIVNPAALRIVEQCQLTLLHIASVESGLTVSPQRP